MRWYEQSGVSKGKFSVLGLSMLIAFEWHLVWAAVSGMETLLVGLLSVVIFLLLQSAYPRYSVAGILIGLGIWIRPDALLLLLPVFWIIFGSCTLENYKGCLINALHLFGGLLMMFVPYLGFNLLTAGTIWPTTFFAKQAEYQVLIDLPLLTRIRSMIISPLIGVGILLLPGFLYHVYDLIRKKEWISIAPYVWVVCYFGAYALRLPVTYQHGRYLMPILPVSLTLGFMGFRKLFALTSEDWLSRIILRTWRLSIPAVLIAFWVIGARAYAKDVAIIESEMVNTARWIQANTQSGAKIAAHDIGAVGYFAHRDLLDLAGLVSPEVIPIIRDEEALEALMNRENVDYLVTFPGWYPYLISVGEKVYDTGASFSPEQGGENMTVYRWPQ
jgi:hypothetical protein